MKAKVIKRQSGSYIRLPDGLGSADEVELHTLRDGFYLLSIPLERHETAKGPPAEKKPGDGLSGEERELLRKLVSIPFGKRVPAYLAKALSEGEKEALKSLKAKGAVSFFRSEKYSQGVFNISKKFYGNVGREQANGYSEAEKQLFRDGHMVLGDQRAAQALSDRLSRQKFSIAGVKSFDGKYYVATRAFLEKVSGLLSKAGEEVEPRMLAEKFGGEPQGYLAALKILSETGDYIEKKGGIFLRVG